MAKQIILALQGGGAHGAFTWGVLDRLLEDPDLEIIGVSGSSGGAINGTLVAYGLLTGGPQAAHEVLHRFWHELAEISMFSPFQPTPLDRTISKGNIWFNPLFAMFRFFISTAFSPYQLNPFNINPLQWILPSLIDFSVFRQSDRVKLFLGATNVRTAESRVFSNKDVTVDAVIASACFPMLFHAVPIDGEYYWDGGYSANPPITPLLMRSNCHDLLVVQVDSINFTQLPYTASQILDRSTDMGFNAGVMQEVKAIQIYNRFVEQGADLDGKLKPVRVHTIGSGDFYNNYDGSSKINNDWDWLLCQHDYGYAQTDRWLQANRDRLG
ncbi:MAG: patatin-like phospholipase family protein [Solirubrobacterales bacterium]